MPKPDAGELQRQRRKVDFDTFDITVKQLLTMVGDGDIDIAPEYQRQFRWDDERQSELVESVFLGIPIPPLFAAQNRDGSWELVDGVQRLCTIVRFAGEDEVRGKLASRVNALVLKGLEKLKSFNDSSFSDLPGPMRNQLLLRPIKVTTISDKSDKDVRFDLFERLNTGGVALTHQEIRACIYRGAFSQFLQELAQNSSFRSVVKLRKSQEQDATAEEFVLRFFAYKERYTEFDHSVVDFLNSFMKDTSESFGKAERERMETEFHRVFSGLSQVLPHGLKRENRSQTPVNLFEAVAVGASLALDSKPRLKLSDPTRFVEDQQLRVFVEQATNNRRSVTGRIEYCRNKFLEAAAAVGGKKAGGKIKSKKGSKGKK